MISASDNICLVSFFTGKVVATVAFGMGLDKSDVDAVFLMLNLKSFLDHLEPDISFCKVYAHCKDFIIMFTSVFVLLGNPL